MADLPEAWNRKMKELLGLDVPDDAQGCLQDVHWSVGYFGYFPSYALGNLYAAQFWATMKAQMPDLRQRLEAGESAQIREWLERNIHKYGSMYLPSELVKRVTGASLDASHFTRYLEEKYSAIYGF